MKGALFLRFARPFVRRKFRGAFENVRILGENELLEALARGPLLVASNHVTFWDALLLVLLDERWGGGGRALMDRKNLRELPFFAKAGAIPIDRENSRRSLEDLGKALEFAKRPSEYLVIFPQGVERPASAPLGYKGGIDWLVRRSKLPVVPMAVRYDFAVSERPFVHVALGAPIAASDFELGKLETRTLELLERIDAEICSLNAPGHSVEKTLFLDTIPRKPPSDRPLGARILAWIFGSAETP